LEVVGKVTGIETKASGFRVISVHPEGKQYPVKVGTKYDETIAQATEAMEWPAATCTYTESDSDNINQHTGEPYKNRYAVSFLPVTPADLAKAAPTQSRLVIAESEQKSIVRAVAAKAAFQFGAYTLAAAKTPEARDNLRAWLFETAEELEAWLTRTPEVALPVVGGDAADAGRDDPSSAVSPPHSDDDIPF
jgi:hypothetical protein